MSIIMYDTMPCSGRYRSILSVIMPSSSSAPSFAGKTVVVVGATRGLGLELAKAFVARGATTYATARKESNPDIEGIGLAGIITGIDLEDEDVGNKIAAGLPEGVILDVLFINAGYFTTETIDELHFDEERKMMEICAFGPLRTIQQLLKKGRLAGDGKSKVAMITSEGGSIGLRTDEEGGGNYGHHMSKCAQNMMGRILAIDLKVKGIPLVMLHPGFLRTTMTEHYSKFYDEFGAVTPDVAVPPILTAVDNLTLETTGKFIAPMGSKGLGLGVHALPGSHLDPQGELPW